MLKLQIKKTAYNGGFLTMKESKTSYRVQFHTSVNWCGVTQYFICILIPPETHQASQSRDPDVDFISFFEVKSTMLSWMGGVHPSSFFLSLLLISSSPLSLSLSFLPPSLVFLPFMFSTLFLFPLLLFFCLSIVVFFFVSLFPSLFHYFILPFYLKSFWFIQN